MKKIGLLFVMLMVLGGCGIAAQSIQTQPPGNVYRINPDSDFRELRENETSSQFGSVLVGIVLTMRAGNQRILGGHPFIVMPYTDGLGEDYTLLLGWGSSFSVNPEDIAKRRDYEGYLNQSVRVYKDKLSTGGVFHLVKQLQTRVNGEAKIDQLPVGNYIITTSLRDYYNSVEWLVKCRVEANRTTEVFLTSSNATSVAR